MKKRLPAIMLSLTMLFSFGINAFAAGSSNNFIKSAEYDGHFVDVSDEAWYYDSVETCYEYGLMNGASMTHFNPSGNLTIAEAIVMAVRVCEVYTTGSCNIENGSPWYQPYIDYAVSRAIIQPNDFTNYNRNITRGEMAYIFAAALPDIEYEYLNYIAEIPDVEYNTPYADEILLLYTSGILTGSDTYGTFHPYSSITRSEAAAILSRVAIKDERLPKTYFIRCSITSTPFSFLFPVLYKYSDGFLVSPDSGFIAYSNSLLSDISESDYKYLASVLLEFTRDFLSEYDASAISIEAVQVGSYPGYRLTYSTKSEEGFTSYFCDYYVIYGGTLYALELYSSENDDDFRTVINSLEINGGGIDKPLLD